MGNYQPNSNAISDVPAPESALNAIHCNHQQDQDLSARSKKESVVLLKEPIHPLYVDLKSAYG